MHGVKLSSMNNSTILILLLYSLFCIAIPFGDGIPIPYGIPFRKRSSRLDG